MNTDPKILKSERKKLVLSKQKQKDQFSLENIDNTSYENAIPEDSYPKGAQKLPQLIFKQAIKLSKYIIPLTTKLIDEFNIPNIQEQLILFPDKTEEIKQEFCPTKLTLDKLIETRNSLVDYLNNTSTNLDSIALTTGFTSDFAGLIQEIVTTTSIVKTTATVAMSAIPFALPGAVPAAIDFFGDISSKLTFNPDGTPRIPKLKSPADQASLPIAISQGVILKAVDELNKIDTLIKLCFPEPTLTPFSDSVIKTVSVQLQAESTDNNSTYKGFIIEIEEVPYNDKLVRRKAVGKNQYGITMIQTSLSFTSNNNILIQELKTIIDKDNLKAY
jgi:hypothetical protein